MSQAASPRFTEKEFEIFEVIAASPDFSTSDIAKVCKLTPRQVKRVLSTLYEKLGISGRGARQYAAELYREATTWSISQRHDELEAATGLRVLLEKKIEEAEIRHDQVWADARRTTIHIGRVGGDEADPHWFELEERLYRAADIWKSEVSALRDKHARVSATIEDILNHTIEEDKHEAAERWFATVHRPK